jgi:hypothetical protein
MLLFFHRRFIRRYTGVWLLPVISVGGFLYSFSNHNLPSAAGCARRRLPARLRRPPRVARALRLLLRSSAVVRARRRPPARPLSRIPLTRRTPPSPRVRSRRHSPAVRRRASSPATPRRSARLNPSPTTASPRHLHAMVSTSPISPPPLHCS